MAELAGDGPAGAPAAPFEPAAPGARMESDFSLRKIKIGVVCLFGQTFATSILPFMALSYVLYPMTKDFGWSRTEFGFANSFLMWSGALVIWALGRLADKFGVRPVIILGTLAVGVVTLALARVQTLWQFYLCFALLGVFGSTGASYSKVIAALFTQNRGKAMAIFGAEGTAVRFFIPMIMAFMILHYSWRGLFNAMGWTILAVTPLVYFGLVEPGAYKINFSLFGRRKAQPDAARHQAAPAPMTFEGATIKACMRDKVFWLILGSTLFASVIANGMMTNVIAALQDKGFSQTTVAEYMSAATLLGLGGTFLGGFLVDRWQSAKVGVPFHLISALGAFLTMIVTPALGGKSMLFVAISCTGFAMAAALPMAAYFQTRFFGLRAFAEIFGFQSMIQAACMGFAPPLMGWIYDTFHSYTIAFSLQIVSALIAAGVFMILPKYRYSANIGAMPAPPKGPPVGGVGAPVVAPAA